MLALETRTETDVIEIADYDKRWPETFRKEKRKMLHLLGDLVLDIQHIGSTAVPGMAAKPIVDILVAVEDMSSGVECARMLVEIGYQNVPHDEDPERLFLYKGMPRTHHIHVVRYGSETHCRHLLFRDYLREHKKAREEYDKLKRRLASRFRNDREAYVDAKADFIENMLKKAVKERGPRPRSTQQKD